MKICLRCQVEQEDGQFGKCKRYKSGIYPYCKTCIRLENRKSYLSNRDARLAKVRTYRKENPEQVAASKKKNYTKNKVAINEKNSVWQRENREKINNRRYERYHNDPAYRVGNLLRSRLAHLLLNGTKTGKLSDYLGCTLVEFKQHLERQFMNGMMWSNHGKGKGKWNIDHIIPLCSGKSPEEITRLNHFSNLRPLWEKDNIAKSSIDKRMKN